MNFAYWNSGVEDVDRIAKLIKTDKRKVRKMLVDSARIARTYCVVCRVMIKNHDRCKGCEILIHGSRVCWSCSLTQEERIELILKNTYHA
jgi:hypothetical protein